MRFTKLHGCGNDYLYVDCITNPAPTDPADLARRISDRHFGAGSDGLILALPSQASDVRMRMFNADGSEGQMCGNGVRGLAKFVWDRGLVRVNPMRVETLRGSLSIQQTVGTDGRISHSTVDMDEPILQARQIPMSLPHDLDAPLVDAVLSRYIPIGQPAAWMKDCGLEDRFSAVSMGSAHMVLFCKQPEAVPLAQVGPFFETQPIFPNRVNVHFAATVSRVAVRMRTWERGSGITLACGTGASAVVVAGVLTGRLDRTVEVNLPGGVLGIEWSEADNHVYMTGPAVEVFSGDWPDR